MSGSRVPTLNLCAMFCLDQWFSKSPRSAAAALLGNLCKTLLIGPRHTYQIRNAGAEFQDSCLTSPRGDSAVLKVMKHQSGLGITIRYICKVVYIFCTLYSYIFTFATIHWVRQWTHFHFTNEETDVEDQHDKEDSNPGLLTQIPGISTVLQLPYIVMNYEIQSLP